MNYMELFKVLKEKDMEVVTFNPALEGESKAEITFSVKDDYAYKYLKENFGYDIDYSAATKNIKIEVDAALKDEMFKELINKIKEIPKHEVPLDLKGVSSIKVDETYYTKHEDKEGELGIIENRTNLSSKEVFEQRQPQVKNANTEDGKDNAMAIFTDLKKEAIEVPMEKVSSDPNLAESLEVKNIDNHVKNIESANLMVNIFAEGDSNALFKSDGKNLEQINASEILENDKGVAFKEEFPIDNQKSVKRRKDIDELKKYKETLKMQKEKINGKRKSLVLFPPGDKAAFAESLFVSLMAGFGAGVITALMFLTMK